MSLRSIGWCVLCCVLAVSLPVAFVWGILASGIGCCLPGNRKRHAKTGFEYGVLVTAVLLLSGQLLASPPPSSLSAGDTKRVRDEAKAFMAEAMPLANEFNAQILAIWGNG